jgi:hypothetical protein
LAVLLTGVVCEKNTLASENLPPKEPLRSVQASLTVVSFMNAQSGFFAFVQLLHCQIPGPIQGLRSSVDWVKIDHTVFKYSAFHP